MYIVLPKEAILFGSKEHSVRTCKRNLSLLKALIPLPLHNMLSIALKQKSKEDKAAAKAAAKDAKEKAGKKGRKK